MSKTKENTKHICTRKCSACKYRKWYGDGNLFYCDKHNVPVDKEMECIEDKFVYGLVNKIADVIINKEK